MLQLYEVGLIISDSRRPIDGAFLIFLRSFPLLPDGEGRYPLLHYLHTQVFPPFQPPTGTPDSPTLPVARYPINEELTLWKIPSFVTSYTPFFGALVLLLSLTGLTA